MKQAEAVATSMGNFLGCLAMERKKSAELMRLLLDYIKSQNPKLYQEVVQWLREE